MSQKCIWHVVVLRYTYKYLLDTQLILFDSSLSVRTMILTDSSELISSLPDQLPAMLIHFVSNNKKHVNFNSDLTDILKSTSTITINYSKPRP